DDEPAPGRPPRRVGGLPRLRADAGLAGRAGPLRRGGPAVRLRRGRGGPAVRERLPAALRPGGERLRRLLPPPDRPRGLHGAPHRGRGDGPDVWPAGVKGVRENLGFSWTPAGWVP